MSTNVNIRGATMDNKLYNLAATGQLFAHDITKQALKDSITRVLKSYPHLKEHGSSTIRFADLGSAGGVNAIRLLHHVGGILNEKNETRPIEYYFEDLPTSDFNELIKTIYDSILPEQFFPMCIGRSFYEKLFPPSTVHLFLSYITLHWLNSCPDIIDSGSEEIEDLKFIQPNEANVQPHIFEKFRSSSIDDLILFLKLRADELCDNGEGLFLMVGGGSLGFDEKNMYDTYGGQHNGFLKGSNGSIFKEAFENAASDPQYYSIQKEIKEAHLAAFTYYFLRCEADVKESFAHVKDILELKELKWENCPIKCGSPSKLADFIWSIHGNALDGSVKKMLNKRKTSDLDAKESMQNTDIIHMKIVEALKVHINILTKRDFPDGNTTASYMYMVVKRKPRK